MKRLLPLLCLLFAACDSEFQRAEAPKPTPTPASAPAPKPGAIAKTTPAPTPTPWRPLHAKPLIEPGNPFSKPPKR